MTNAVSIAQLGSSNGTMRNRIINGAMTIDQRNAGASITPNNQYFIDRYQYQNSATGKLTIQQNAGSVTPPTGFSHYMGITSSSAYTPTSGQQFCISQIIEGYNCSDFAYGTASAQNITLSFWIRSSVAATFSGSVQIGDQSYSYPFNYTINSTNTWEQKSITIPGNTSVSLPGTNNAGMRIFWDMGSGSTFKGTVNTWQSGNFCGATGSSNVIGTNAATWYLTGVQLEVGSTATPFEYRPYGMELSLCQRYYWQKNGLSTGNGATVGSGFAYNTTDLRFTLVNPVTMRTTPTVSFTGSNFEYEKTAAARGTLSTLDSTYRSPEAVMIYSGSGTTSTTAGQGAIMYITSSASYISLSAEL